MGCNQDVHDPGQIIRHYFVDGVHCFFRDFIVLDNRGNAQFFRRPLRLLNSELGGRYGKDRIIPVPESDFCGIGAENLINILFNRLQSNQTCMRRLSGAGRLNGGGLIVAGCFFRIKDPLDILPEHLVRVVRADARHCLPRHLHRDDCTGIRQLPFCLRVLCQFAVCPVNRKYTSDEERCGQEYGQY